MTTAAVRKEVSSGEVIPPANAGKLNKYAMADVVALVAAVATMPELLQFPGPSTNHLDDFMAGDSDTLTGTFYDNHIRILNEALQGELSKHFFPLPLRLIAVKTINGKIRELIARGEFDPEEDGRAWPSQVETLAITIAKIIRNPHRSVLIVGATQLGKTMTVILLSVLEMLLFITTGNHYKVIYLSPIHRATTKQTKKDYVGFCSLYDFEVEYKGKTYRYSDYRERMASKVVFNESHPELNLGNPILARNKPNVAELRDIIAKLHKQNIRAVIVVDECHWGSQQEYTNSDGKQCGKDGIMKQMLAFAKELAKADQGDLIIAISATPFNWSVSHMNLVFCRVVAGYIGYAFWRGKLLVSRPEDLILPDVHGFGGSYIRDTLQIGGMGFVNRNYYRNQKAYDKAKVAKEGRGANRDYTPFAMFWKDYEWEMYRRFCEEKLLELAEACLIRHNDKQARGFIIRFFRSNPELNVFIGKYESRMRKKGI